MAPFIKGAGTRAPFTSKNHEIPLDAVGLFVWRHMVTKSSHRARQSGNLERKRGKILKSSVRLQAQKRPIRFSYIFMITAHEGLIHIGNYSLLLYYWYNC